MTDLTDQIKPVTTTVAKTTCYHCGLDCKNDDVAIGDKVFCCNGCKMVYEILEANDLCQYYDLNENPGTTPSEAAFDKKFGYLDDPQVVEQIRDFSDGRSSKVSFTIPSIHCSSCIWILESLYRLDPGISRSRTNYVKKQVSITYKNTETSLRKIVELLASLGYEPELNLKTVSQKVVQKSRRSLYLRLGIAGFSLGNSMLLSLPEYLAAEGSLVPGYARLFAYLNIALALPVFFYSARDYFISAWGGLRHKALNIDVPIALGIITLFLRSLVDIIILGGPGWMDSFIGFVFLLLLGKLFQERTYQNLSFDRDFKSYFPLAVVRINKSVEESIPLARLHVGDRIVIRNNEIIPTDSVLINGNGWIDYSFVTGESAPVVKSNGDKLFAGGKQVAGAIEVDVVEDVSQSYLTQLWNDDTFTKHRSTRMDTIANSISKYFTFGVLSVASAAGIYWWFNNPALVINAFTSVLIIACPCALALSVPFTLGNTLRIFGRREFYLKNTAVIEALAKISTIIFDKTGTLTDTSRTAIEFVPAAGTTDLSVREMGLVRSVVRHSTHPLSRRIYESLPADISIIEPNKYDEITGKGLEAQIGGQTIRLGSPYFISGNLDDQNYWGTAVALSIDGEKRGTFSIRSEYRRGVHQLIASLKNYRLWLLSGDNDGERQRLKKYFDHSENLLFNQSSFNKLDKVKKLQSAGETVLMVGDGLNDAGALKQSAVGLSISEDINTFSPACDGILGAGHFRHLGEFLRFSKTSMTIIKISFGISFLYNLIGLTFAVQGVLSPLISAILMPLSSITVVVFATVSTNLLGRKIGRVLA
ncbi:MAG: heavy metal translocating P-type ATPase metal-binding domain-containing protein [Candidatus Marinimicrobia bacterium]|nr:heavy metal translocating P-type ATPase metal-binding domain-containing protein [Candidatus Neomarinimicrobiota bacterium]